MILTTAGGVIVTERQPAAMTRAGLYVQAVGGPGGRAELDSDEVEELVDTLQAWLERNGRARR